MDWGFIWLMFALKVPVAMLLGIVWWAVRAQPEPEPASDDEDGGSDRRAHPHRGAPRPWGRDPRTRGPHGGTALAAPRRVRGPAPARGRRTPAR